MRITRLNWQEPAAYIFAVISLFAGVILGTRTNDPAWLGRAGSVIIVCGVLLASSRKIDVLEMKARALAQNHRETQADSLLSEFTNPDGSPITAEQAKSLKARIYGEAGIAVGALIDERRRVFKLHEIILVVVGTLVNGFGEWLLKALA